VGSTAGSIELWLAGSDLDDHEMPAARVKIVFTSLVFRGARLHPAGS
jgi:hypothetical protein